MSVDSRLSVRTALLAMQAAIRSGAIQQARDIGGNATIPLSLSGADVQQGQKLSEGSESIVYCATYAGQSVVVKKFKITNSLDLVRFRKELEILSTLNHPHIVRVLGAKALPPDYAMVLPMHGHNLQHMLYEQGWRPTWPQILRIASQLASAMHHVHSCGVLHRDIKPSNLLMSLHEESVHLSDFGISEHEATLQAQYADSTSVLRTAPSGGFHKAHMVGTLQYMPPEVLQKRPHTQGADVYAFAVTVNELATAMVPFSDCTKDNPECHTVLEMGYSRQELAAAVAGFGLRPTLPKQCPPGFRDLMEACWRGETRERPGFGEVLQQLQQVTDALESWTPTRGRESGCGMKRSFSEGMLFGEQEGLDGRHLPDVMALSEPEMMLCDSSDNGSTSCEGAYACGASRFDMAHSPPSPSWSVEEANAGAGAGAGAGFGSGAARFDRDGCTGTLGWVGEVTGRIRQMQVGGGALPGGTWLERVASDVGGHEPMVMGGMCETAGPREKMEDRSVVVQPLVARGTAGVAVHLFAVLDGHRGHEAAHYAAGVLPEAVRQQLAVGGSAEDVMRSAFLGVDRDFTMWAEGLWREKVRRTGGAAGSRRYPGCTALAALVAGDRLVVANAGDCRAVLCRGGKAVQLTRDHTACDEGERRRIEAAGGMVKQWADTWRVGFAGLQVTRSIGDVDEKKGGVTACPEVQEFRVGVDDEFLILATDGLWEAVGCEDAVGLVKDTVKEAGMSAKRLVMEAIARGGGDNISVVVVFLTGFQSVEKVFGQGVSSQQVTPTVYGTRVNAAKISNA